MCGHYALHGDPASVARHFALDAVPDFAPQKRLAPGAAALIVKAAGPALARWGFLGKTHAARAETLALKPSLHHAYHRRRCLVPASGYYEAPRYVRPARGELFAMAGLWESTGEQDTFTILTLERVPVILAPAHYAGWLHGEEGLLRPVAASALRSELQPRLLD